MRAAILSLFILITFQSQAQLSIAEMNGKKITGRLIECKASDLCLLINATDTLCLNKDSVKSIAGEKSSLDYFPGITFASGATIEAYCLCAVNGELIYTIPTGQIKKVSLNDVVTFSTDSLFLTNNSSYKRPDIVEQKIIEAGDLISKGSGQQTAGYALMLGGGLATYINPYLGGGIALVGVVFQFIGLTNIKKGGEKMKEFKLGK